MNVLKSRLLSLAPVIALAIGTTACGSDDTDGDSTEVKQLEIFSWLTAGSEKSSLDKLLGVVQTRVPGIQIRNAAQDEPQTARDLLKERMAQNLPPDSFQVISGADIKEWIKKGALEPIDSLAASEGWNNSIPSAVLESVKGPDGKLYGAPLNTERDNTLFYNKTLMEGMDPPKTVAQFLTVAAALKAKGVTPLTVPAKAGWTIASMVFESVLVAEAGPTFYKEYLEGKKAADAPEMRAALEGVAKMLDYSADTRGGKTWTDSVKDVCNGDAAMIVLPDFIKGEFASQCPNTAVDYVPMEGATPTFVFVGIAFPLVVGAPHRSMAIEFLKTVGSKAGQDAFNPTKGSVGVRTDLSREGLDAISQKTLLQFEQSAGGAGLVPAYAALTSSAFQETVNPALQKFCDPAAAEHKNVESVIIALRQAYPSLAQ